MILLSIFFSSFTNRKLLLVLVAFILACHSYSQEKQYMFSTYNKNDGLSNNNVLAFLRDSKGFLWIGTTEGLNRFDGYSFKKFTHIPGDSTSLRSNNISFLKEGPNGKIWIRSSTYLDIYDPVHETIEHVDSIFNGKLLFLE